MLSTKLLANAAALIVALSASAPAFAVCPQCNSDVRLDAALATCFSDRADDELTKLTASGKTFIMVNLADCSSRGGLPTASASAKLPLDKLFVVDADSIKCLAAEIAAVDETALDPNHLFDLTKDCPAQ